MLQGNNAFGTLGFFNPANGSFYWPFPNSGSLPAYGASPYTSIAGDASLGALVLNYFNSKAFVRVLNVQDLSTLQLFPLTFAGVLPLSFIPISFRLIFFLIFYDDDII